MKLESFAKAMATLVLIGSYSVNGSSASAQPADAPSESGQSAGQPADKLDAEAGEQPVPAESKSKPAKADQRRAWLGVELLEGPDGVRIASVVVDSPAFTAGLRPGDRIVSVNDTKTPTAPAVVDSIGKRSPRDKVTIEVVRGGECHKITAVLGTAPSTLGHPPIAKPLVPSDLRLDSHLSPEMEQMQQRVEALEKEVESLRREISELRNRLEKDGPDTTQDDQPSKLPPEAGAIEL